MSLFKNHLSLKPHGDEFPQSSALIFLLGDGTAGGLHPLEPVPRPHKAKLIWNTKFNQSAWFLCPNFGPDWLLSLLLVAISNMALGGEQEP